MADSEEQELENGLPASRPGGFPEYGGEIEQAEARRMRRSFRFGVAACVLFAGALWFSEKYLRYDLEECQYIAALTLEPESARAVLAQTVKRDAEKHEFPTPKYVEALADREEADLLLPTYEKAYKLDPDNPFLAIRYGCCLFQKNQYGAACERFRETRAHAPNNALPRYLEAASLSLAEAGKKDLTQPLVLVAKTNGGNDEIVFPRPLWSPELPEGGVWHQKLRRQIEDDCCAPLYQFSDRVMELASGQIAVRQVQYWDSWLENLQSMGERLASGPRVGTIPAIAGTHIQLEAIEQRQAVRLLETGTADPALEERRAKLKSCLNELQGFETRRDALIAADRKRYQMVWYLCWESVGIVALFYFFAYAISKLFGAGRRSWGLPHSRLGKRVLAGGFLALLVMLWAASAMQRKHVSAPVETIAAANANGFVLPSSGDSVVRGMGALVDVWWAVLGVMLGFGVIYPRLRLPKVAEVIRTRNLDGDREMLRQAKTRYRIAYCSFLRRYYGILAGVFLCLSAFWIIGYRIWFSLYPWEIKLLTTGLADIETEVVKHAVSLVN